MHHHPFVSVLVLSACAPLIAQAEPARPAPTAPAATEPAAPSPSLTPSGPSQATAKAENNGSGTRNTAASAQSKPGLK